MSIQYSWFRQFQLRGPNLFSIQNLRKNQFVMPFLNANGISSDELVWAELQKSKYSDESKIVLIRSLEDSNKKKTALLDIIRLVNKPWPKSLQEFVTSILVANPNQ